MRKQILTFIVVATVFAVNPAFAMDQENQDSIRNNIVSQRLPEELSFEKICPQFIKLLEISLLKPSFSKKLSRNKNALVFGGGVDCLIYQRSPVRFFEFNFGEQAYYNYLKYEEFRD